MYCTNCGCEVEENQKYCFNCGEEIVRTKTDNLCVLCGRHIKYGEEICEQCKKDYEVPTKTESEKEILVKNKEKQEGVLSIILAFLFPAIGLLLGIIFCIKNNDKSKPFLAIVISIFSFWINWYFLYQHLV